jgi:hypothetical protein
MGGGRGRFECGARNFDIHGEGSVKARLLACAAGFVCAFPLAAGAQVTGANPARPYSAGPPPSYAPGPPPFGDAVSAREIAAGARSAGFELLTEPVRRGPVYVMRAVNRQGIRVRILADAHSGRILAVNRVLMGPVVGEAAPPPPPPQPRYQPYLSGRGYYENAPLPPGDVPTYRPDASLGPPTMEARPNPERAPAYGTPQPGKKVAARPPAPRARPGDTPGEVTGSVTAPAANPVTGPVAAAPAPAAKPAETAPSAPNPVPAKPQMVPIAPLE